MNNAWLTTHGTQDMRKWATTGPTKTTPVEPIKIGDGGESLSPKPAKKQTTKRRKHND